MAQFSIITPVFNPRYGAFEECIKSVLGQKFEDWEWCIADDCSTSEEVIQRLEELEKSDPRIRVIHRSTNGGITQASNDALGIASGNYIALLDHDDSLALEALEIVNNVIVLSPGSDYIYSDEDKINEGGFHFDEFRKPDWAPERLLGQNYCCHLSVFRHSLVKQVGGFHTDFEGSQDYDLILRVSELSTYIHHIPEVLYHWRVVQGSAAGEQFAKPYAIEAARKAVEEHLKRTSVEATVTSTAHGYQKVVRRLHSFPKVSIVIPSAAYSRTVWGKESLLLDECLKSILQKSTYPNYEVIVVLDNNAFRENASLKKTMNDERIVVIDYEKPFNFSDKCNIGAVAASGEILLFLNDDTEVITPDWLEILVGHLSDPGVGAVGARLLLEDGTIQSAGHANNPSPHSFGLARSQDDPGQFGALAIAQERSGITGACLGMQRDLYLLVGGMSLDFPHCFNDVDLCFKILELKKRLIWTPFADLFHFESLSRNPTPRDEELEAIYERWVQVLWRRQVLATALSRLEFGVSSEMVNSFPSRITQVRNRFNSLHPDLRKYLIYALAVLFVYALLVSCRITTSHTGIMTGSASEKSTILLGQPRQERSDEFLRGSPLVIASLRGTPASYKTPFELTNAIQAEGNLSLSKRTFNFLQSPDALLNRVLISTLPLENAFTANWWSLHLLLFLALPAWFLLMGGRLNVAVATSIGVTSTATSAWFSYLPMQLIAYSSGGMTCLILAVRVANRRDMQLWRFPIVLTIGLLAGKYFVPVIQYPPWGFPVLGVATCFTLGWILEIPTRLRPLWIWPTLALSAAFMAFLTYLVNKDLYSAALSTVYPGQRRAVGGGGETPFLGGSLSWVMQTSFARKSGFTNPEYAYGPTFLLIVGAFLCSLNWRYRKRLSGLLGSLLALVVASIVCVWGTATWPKLLQVVNPLKFIPGSRATMIVGTLAILIVGHAFATYASPQTELKKGVLSFGPAVLCGSLIAIFISEDVEWLRIKYFIGTPPWQGFVSILGASILGAFLVLRSRITLALWATMILIFAGTLFVNPITVGLGPLKKSDALQTLQNLARTDKTARWASSGYSFDALIISSGIPQLSGQQFLAPNEPFWREIDPKNEFKPFWNRGQSYVNLQLAPGYKFQIWNPSPDVIQIVGDPCDTRFSRVKLGWYISPAEINSSCFNLKSQTTWLERPLYLYKVSKN